MAKINVIPAEDEMVNKFYDGSMLTLEGLAEESYQEYADFVEEGVGLKNGEMTIYVLSGEQMNRIYELRGNNAYPDDCHILVTPLDCFNNVNKLALFRMQFGGRWFDDIVDNNANRGGLSQEEIEF